MMTRRDVVALVRAMRESNGAPSVVTIDRSVSGAIAFGVKASGKNVKAAREKAEEAFDILAKKYRGEKS